MIGSILCSPFYCTLKIDSWYGSFVWTWCQSLSSHLKNFRFLKKVFVLQKICFKVKVLKTFKISADCHITYLSNRGLFWKSLVPIFKRTYALSVVFKMKPLRKSIKTKTNIHFVVKLAERSNHSFFLSLWWITFFSICTLWHL